ncbi:hypothetical protein [Haloarcula marismortui]|uniref:Uncharacterized protein n=1 Tax=Haloarcula marismortui ATCC 33800 TaxID=662476 RepID=A0A8T8K8M0_9EURY|nr:hypothetical protein [Haloarcula sinaiiensis]QUJ71260.1 hypothetical protein KDQ40_11095 [Haloarcula sinaiiensis ATCC 33800]
MAEFRRGIKWLLFLSSYIPLFVLLAVKHRSMTVAVPNLNISYLEPITGVHVPVLSIFWIIVAAVSGIVLKAVFSIRKSRGADSIQKINNSRSRDDLITNYVLVYIFPFVVLDYTNLANWFAFILFFFVIGIVQVKSNQLYVNPVLSFFDYRIYEADTDRGEITVLSRGKLDESEPVHTVELSNDVHITI